MSLQLASQIIQLHVYIEQRQRLKKEIAFALALIKKEPSERERNCFSLILVAP